MNKDEKLTKKKKKYSCADKAFFGITYTVFGLLALICIYPFYYLVINTVSRNDYVDLGVVMYRPIGFHIQNYINIFKLDNVANSMFISVSRTVLGTFLPVLFSSKVSTEL